MTAWLIVPLIFVGAALVIVCAVRHGWAEGVAAERNRARQETRLAAFMFRNLRDSPNDIIHVTVTRHRAGPRLTFNASIPRPDLQPGTYDAHAGHIDLEGPDS